MRTSRAEGAKKQKRGREGGRGREKVRGVLAYAAYLLGRWGRQLGLALCSLVFGCCIGLAFASLMRSTLLSLVTKIGLAISLLMFRLLRSLPVLVLLSGLQGNGRCQSTTAK